MKLPLINHDDAVHSLEILKQYYDHKMIPAEKKPYLSLLEGSHGPYMGLQGSDGKTHYMLDAASQIATLGHGFNASVFFGAAEFQESWTNDQNTKEFKNLRKAYTNFFQRKLNWKNTYVTYVHSGAEANETALGYCYQKRVHKNANKVLAFQGSFHGRMLVTLAATWNKSKREPFEWKNFLQEYVPYPDLPHGNIVADIPAGWREFWHAPTAKTFSRPSQWDQNPEVKKEIDSLLQIREKLLTKEIFAIIVEPMQCEGGDCYSSNRFHTALLLMARSFKVPVIHDEVQTGFHLGKEFFWHRQLNLKDINGDQLNPDYVTCAKKAQIGIVLTHWPTKNVFKGEEFSVASAIRGYIHAISLDQAQAKIHEIERLTLARLEKLLNKHSKYLSKPRTNGLAFAFDIHDPTLLNKFVDLRFKHGLLYYPAGDRTLRFRLNTVFHEKDLDFLFDRLDAICHELFDGVHADLPTHVETIERDQEELYDWHKMLIENKILKHHGKNLSAKTVLQKAEGQFKKKGEFEIVEINAQNFLNFRQQIIELEKIVYEPARQTDIEKFEHTVLHANSLCLGVVKGKTLMAIAFAGPLKLYPLERGVRLDPHFNDEETLYMLDLTVHPEAQGAGLGRMLKYTLQSMALTKGIKRIHGRNRDRLAGPMLNINLSLGSVELNYMKEDYPDFEDHRDVFYYTSRTDWQETTTNLSSGISQPITKRSLDMPYVEKLLPYLVNKVCLSNFVSHDFLNATKEIFQALPTELRHGFTCSGQSEATDKVVKTLWVKASKEKKDHNAVKQLTFQGHYFGQGSMFARSLTLTEDNYFPVTHLSKPNEQNMTEILLQVETELKSGDYLAVWLEPVLQKTMEKVPLEFIVKLKELSKKYNVALVFNETGAQAYSFNRKTYFASNDKAITPDAGLCYLSGQAAIAFATEENFLEQPLMMISTWDGDEFSFLTYAKSFQQIQKNPDHFMKTADEFQKILIDKLSEYDLEVLRIQNGRGHFKGSIPSTLSKYFKEVDNSYIVNPSFDAMLDFIEQNKK